MTLSEDRATGALWAFQFDAGPAHAGPHAGPQAGKGRFVPDQEQQRCLEAADGWSWMHFPLSDQRAQRFIAQFPTLPEQARQFLLGGERRLQVHNADGWVFGILPDIERDFDGHALDIGRLNFALNARYVLTTRRPALRGVYDVRRAIEEGAGVATPAALFVMLVEHFIDLTEARQQDLALDLDSLEDRVLGMQADPSRIHVGPVRRELSRQHREFLALRAAFHRAAFHRGHAQAHLLSEPLPALTQQLEDFDRDAADLLERARLLHDEIEEQITATTNRSLRALTILSTLMLPPTVIVGAFGMNLDGITFAHEPWGFAAACGLCVIAVGLSYGLLRAFNILR